MTLRLCCLLLLLPSYVWANSTVCYGVIVEANAKGRRGPSIVVRSAYQTPRTPEDQRVQWRVSRNALITLDGKPSNFDAFQPGRLVVLCADANYFKVYSDSYRLGNDTPATNPAQASWWTLHLPVKLKQPTGRGSSGLTIHLDVVDGQVRKAVGLTPGWGPSYGSSPAWHDVDAADLRVADGKLEGHCSLKLRDRGALFPDGASVQPHRLEFSLGPDGAGTVAMDGTELDADRVRVQCRAIPTIPDEWYCFLRAPDPDARTLRKPDGRKTKPRNLRLEIRRRDGEVSCPAFVYGGGKPGAGRPATGIEMTLADGDISIHAGNGQTDYALHGFVLGERIFGTAQAAQGETKWECRFSGYLRKVDSPSIGWSEGAAKKEAKTLRANEG